VLVLCDTNGGMTGRLAEIVADVRKRFDGVLGIHAQRFRCCRRELDRSRRQGCTCKAA
jgi:hypothetical protein